MARVIAPFIDSDSGKRINPGDQLPAGLTEDRQRKLLKAGCIVLEGETETKPAPKRIRKKAAAKGAVASDTLFPVVGNPEGAADNADPDPESLAGGDGGDTGAGSEPDGDGRDAGDEQSQDDSSR